MIIAARRQPNEFGLPVVKVSFKPSWLERLLGFERSMLVIRHEGYWLHMASLLRATPEVADAADKAYRQGAAA